jgi:starch-binding outer membrane protein, SusD/RagB family
MVVNMKLILSKKISVAFIIIFGLAVFNSCKKIVDVKPKDAVDQTQMYRNVFDADAAVIGVYGKVMNLAKQYVLFNELRADLMDVTTSSDQYIKQLSEHNVTADNPYINPRSFYEVILNCNDVLKNFALMYQQNKLKTEEYNQRYSDVGAIRTWLYLQLGIHFGKVPYVTNPLTQLDDLKDVSKFPTLDLESSLIDTLVRFAESLPYTNDYPTGTTLMTTIDGYNTSKFFINKNILLGELYLWDGQYHKAAESFRKVMDINGPTGNTEQFYNQYKGSSFNEAGISYGNINNTSSLVYTPGWRYLFERSQDNPFNYEWIWALPFDKNFAPVNPFIDLFYTNYQVKPSQTAIDNWNNQVQTVLVNNTPISSIPGDARGWFSYRVIGGQPVIMKYLYNYLNTGGIPIDALSKQGRWFLERATTLHLHYAEAANRDNHSRIAYALVNRGLRDTYDSLQPTALTTDSIGKTYRSYSQNRDVTNQENTLKDPDAIYQFDARMGDAPAYRSSWYRNQGIRARANLFAVKIPTTDSVTNIENMIINESGLELAYEGQRWSDLLRIAIRRKDPAFIADKIYQKLIKSGLSAGAASQARARLQNGQYYLPFNWK